MILEKEKLASLKTNPNDKVFKLKEFQSRFIKSKARYPAQVSAWATGKSLDLIALALRLSETPNNLGVIFRKEFTDLRDSTIKDFELYTGMKVDSARNVTMPNGSVIMFRHLEEINNIQNMNLGWFAIEQAEELETDEQFFMLIGRLRRNVPEHKGFIVANTKGHNWIYKLWKLKQLDDSELIEAQTSENADILPPEYLKSLEALKVKKPKIYNRFVKNSWDEADTIDLIIQPSWVEEAKNSNIIIRYPIRRIVSIDVARGGADKSVLRAIENYKSLGREEHNTRNTMELVGRALVFAKKLNIEAFAVDEIGVGGGVADRISELGKEVIFVNAAERTEVPAPYFNRRAEILGFGAMLFEEGKIQIEKNDDILAEQLSWTHWKPMKSTGILQAESKDDVRAEHGQSPDDADSFLNGIWALSQVKPIIRDAYEESEKQSQFNPMTV